VILGLGGTTQVPVGTGNQVVQQTQLSVETTPASPRSGPMASQNALADATPPSRPGSRVFVRAGRTGRLGSAGHP
jgi:hypothetical protein